MFGNILYGSIGRILREEGVDWQEQATKLDEKARGQRCYAGEGSAASALGARSARGS